MRRERNKFSLRIFTFYSFFSSEFNACIYLLDVMCTHDILAVLDVNDKGTHDTVVLHGFNFNIDGKWRIFGSVKLHRGTHTREVDDHVNIERVELCNIVRLNLRRFTEIWRNLTLYSQKEIFWKSSLNRSI